MVTNLDAEIHATEKSSLESQHEHKLRSKLSGIIQFHNKQCQTINQKINHAAVCTSSKQVNWLFSPTLSKSEYTTDCKSELNECLSTKFIKLPEHLDPSAYTLTLLIKYCRIHKILICTSASLQYSVQKGFRLFLQPEQLTLQVTAQRLWGV